MSDDQTADPTVDETAPEIAPAVDDGVAVDADPSTDDRTEQADEQDGQADERKHPLWQESLLLVGIALVLAVVVKAFFLQAFYIPSPSMEPGLVENDRILVQKPSYWGGGSPSRGDVVVFEDPGGWLNAGEDAGPGNAVSRALAKVGLFPSGGHLVKRVIGVAGDTIVCCDVDHRLIVNGKSIDETDYVKDEKGVDCAGPMTGNCKWTAGPVPEGKIFVMGDNRAHSGDSSAHLCTEAATDCTEDPYVDVDSVTGKVMTLVWPISHWGFLHRPDVFGDIPDPK